MTNVLVSRSWIWQIVGFSLGVWLLWTVLQGAAQAGDFSALRDADPMLLVLMLVLSLASSVCNAALFTLVSRPLQHQPSLSLQRMVPLNFSCGALNYAPFRLGALTRVAWHIRVDGMNASRVSALMAMAGGWYLLVGLTAFGAFWLRPSADWGTLGLGLLLLPAGWALGRMGIAKLPGGLFREARPMLNNPRASLECAGLRILDLMCFTGRLLVGARILNIELGLAEGVLLAVVATFASLVPFGRLGFREAGVAGAAGAIGSIDPGLRDQLSLLDSAAEAAAYVPLGLVLSVLWLRPHFKRVQSKSC
ncbi:MAG: hypothetical protein CBD11_01250 [Phycisphaera sp. TMED151]|jgi:uncharacterized membrane protein YbhN (UPF0104 family)|nr:MAG: hypothetical protein CBD11_01250 [Phycisphaera sp. TMED151]RZO53327.1 MAG: hypothetical protein EVA77_07305 [Phycisphaeraceae bacterium]